MSGPSSSPRPERAPRPGVTWQTELVRVEQLVDDDAPDPRPNRQTRRAMKRAARRRAPAGQKTPDELRERAATDDLATHPPTDHTTEK